MKDFNGNQLEIGDTIFFAHKIGQVIIGKITEFQGKKTIYVGIDSIIKSSPKFVMGGDSLVVYSDRVIRVS